MQFGFWSLVPPLLTIGLGQPVFGKLHAALGAAMLSINAAKAFEYGDGFKGLKQKGSEQNDVFYNNNGRIETRTNHSGGIQGGISNGQDIYFRVAIKLQDTPASAQLKTIRFHGQRGGHIFGCRHLTGNKLSPNQLIQTLRVAFHAFEL